MEQPENPESGRRGEPTPRRLGRPAIFAAVVLALAVPLAAAEGITDAANPGATRLTVRQWSEAAVRVVKRLVKRQVERPATTSPDSTRRPRSLRRTPALPGRVPSPLRLNWLLTDLPPPAAAFL